MSQADLARLRERATTDQCDIADRVVRRAVGSHAQETVVLAQLAGHAVDLRGLQSLIDVQGWKDRRQAFREHRLARARWTDQDDIVSARRSDLEGTLDVLLSFHLRDVHGIALAAGGELRLNVHNGRSHLGASVQQVHHIEQVVHSEHFQARDDGGFTRIGARQDQPLEPP